MQLREIDKRIGALRGMVQNVNTFVQETAIAIVEHFAEHGDCTRAGKLVQALPNSFRREYLIRFFGAAGIAIGRGEDGYPSKAIAKDSKRYVTPSDGVNFARTNNWFEAVDDEGKRAPWYQGPTPAEQEPNTLVDFADNIINFADRTAKQVKEGKLRNSSKPMYSLTDEQKQLVSHALGLIRQTAMAIRADATKEQAERELALLSEQAKAGLEAFFKASKTTDEGGTNTDDESEPVAASA